MSQKRTVFGVPVSVNMIWFSLAAIAFMLVIAIVREVCIQTDYFSIACSAKNTIESKPDSSPTAGGSNGSDPNNAINERTDEWAEDPEDIQADPNIGGPQSEIRNQLSREEAVDIIEDWLSAKAFIFAYPYDRSVLSRYVIQDSPLYKDSLKAINWLSDHSSSYNYSDQYVGEVWAFDNFDNRAEAHVRITESRVLHTPDGEDDSQSGKNTVENYRYIFVQSNTGSWKIFDYMEDP